MKMRKALVATACACLLVVGSVAATMAYLTSQTGEVQNTFTIGKVNITLDEANVNECGVKYDVSDRATGDDGWVVDNDNSVIHDNEGRGILKNGDDAARVLSNSYKLVPGYTYTKDPKVTVKAGSEECYVRMLVTIHNISNVKAVLGEDFLPQYFVEGWDGDKWASTPEIASNGEANTATYEFRYSKTVDARNGDVALEPLFASFTLPGTVTEENIQQLQGLQIDIVAHAIQAYGFEDADGAWGAFKTQNPEPSTPQTPAQP